MGEHSREVLTEAGFSLGEIALLLGSRAVMAEAN